MTQRETPPSSTSGQRTYIIGARGSGLSLRQVQLVSELLLASAPGVALDTREIRTEGDRSTAPLSQIGGLGVFTKAIEDALIAHEIDIAVHSLKDLPPQLPDGLVIAAVPERADVRDALITADGRRLEELPPGARIGTGSARRAVQLVALRADVVPAEIRGNVDTRIRKVESGEYAAAVLAIAGLQRLGLEAKASQIFSTEAMLPAVGQGALAMEVRADDAATLAFVQAIDHRETRIAVEAERAFLARLGAGCRMPVGAHALVRDGSLHITAMIAEEGGPTRRHSDSTVWNNGTSIRDARALGTRVADAMMAANR